MGCASNGFLNHTFAFKLSTDVWKSCQETRREKKKSDWRTFENNDIVWHPYVAKSPRLILLGFKKNPARLINENTDLRMPKVVDWVGSKFAHVLLPRCGEIREFVKMRVLLKSKTSFSLE
jgi:hypothetical protein